MENLFEKQQKASKPSYPQYFLQYNPFHVSDALKEKPDAGDARALFLRHVYQKEINKVMGRIAELANQPGLPRLWILKDTSVAAEHNISVIGGVFRSILRSEYPRFFPTYTPLPMLMENPLREITHLLIDRFQEPIFRRCIYAFIHRDLQELLESNRASEVLPELDVADLLQQMEETSGEAIEEMLFPKKEEDESEVSSQELEEEESEEEEQTEEQPEVESEEGDEPRATSDEPEESEEERRQREQAERLADFIVEAAKQKQFGEQVEGAIEASVRHGFGKGHSNLAQYVKYRELIPGLMRLMLYCYDKIVVLVDQLDFWEMLEDTAKGRIIGALSEFEWLAQDKALLIFAGEPSTMNSIGESYAASFVKQTLDLRLSSVDVTNLASEEQAIEILSEFLNSDPYRSQSLDHVKEKGLSDQYPFTEEAIRIIVEHKDGGLAGVLDVSEELLGEGKRKGYPPIDGEFVKTMLAQVGKE